MTHTYPKQTTFERLTFQDECNTFFGTILLEGMKDDILGLAQLPCIIDVAGLCICLQGSARIIIESRSYHMQSGDMCVAFPNDIIQVLEKSKDFKGYTLACTQDFLMSVNIASSTSLYLHAKNNPCISLAPKEQKELLTMCEFLKAHDSREDHPCREEISKCLVAAIIHEVVGIYKRGNPLQQQPYSRKDQLYFEFTELIIKHCRKHHNVEYYARKLCITSRYLSVVCKEIAGFTATEYINHHIIVNARLLLATTDMTILQISEELNFANASFFTQFFKKHEGCTPKEYRGRG
ncbi:helix-turn-helix domain-containing protein [Bacteroides sp. OttesenSCG-928-D19]|nr:helix-turn-helix domain-containing protein [Bacteroides sp. OttesenSCG-928-N06]MDL2305883.1 helix-turn-helix domain-containing protein [Bacteroides sp. OttesenSCG-928-D19]